MIQNQIVEKTTSALIRVRSKLEVSIILSKALTIARQVETSGTEVKAMSITVADGTVHAI